MATAQDRYKKSHPEIARRAVLTWRKRNPEKVRAQELVHRALKSGDLIRSEICNECGRWDGWHGMEAGTLHGHHMDYLRPLEVEWLCKWCHGEVTREVRFG